MASKKSTQGSKARTAKRTAGETVKSEEVRLPRTPKQLAAAVFQRLKRSPNYWRETTAIIGQMEQVANATTQSEPRTQH